MATQLNIMWFRQDLRLADNPALAAAAAGAAVLPVYILADDDARAWAMGGASRWWLHRSLAALDRSLDGRLVLLRGSAAELLPQLARASGAAGVHWNRCCEPWRAGRDKELQVELEAGGVRVEIAGGSHLWGPDEVLKKDGTPYRVFTPYFNRGCLGGAAPLEPRLRPDLELGHPPAGLGLPLAELGLLGPHPWHAKLEAHWVVGEAGAAAALQRFVTGGLDGYAKGRDYPARPHTSRLSPHLHFGEISPHQVWHAVGQAEVTAGDREHLRREVGWREFSHYLLHHFPSMPEENLQPHMDLFPWRWESPHLAAWQQGRTGIPFVDAGLRELWQTGFMHNRVRMVTASFLVKNLLIDWRLGAEWFWDCLVDADLANNSAGWQWVAGSGADAAPYFRIFNPVTQGLRFDPDGRYVRRFVPEVGRLPDKFVHCPWLAPPAVLSAAGITLGRDYPHPVVDLKESRAAALAALASSKRS